MKAILTSRGGTSIAALVALATIFSIVVVALYVQILDRQEQLLSAAEEDALWASYQLDREALKLRNAVKLLPYDQNAPNYQAYLDDAQLRFDILYSRLNIISTGQLKDMFNAIPNAQALRVELRRHIDAVDPLLFSDSLNRAKIVDINQHVEALLNTTETIVLEALERRSENKVAERNEMNRLFGYLGILVAILTAIMMIIIVILIRQVKVSIHSYNKTKKLANELHETAQAAQAATRAKSDFLATMSHEIRTPMNAILGMSHLVLDSELLPKQRHYVEKIQGSANGLLLIINDILDFSKVEAGKLQLEHAPYSLDATLEYVYEICRKNAQDKGLHFIVERDVRIEDELIGDVTRLKQVLVNIVGNAVKFTEEGEVSLSVVHHDDNLLFTITDSGIGIDSNGDIFEGFSQADTSTTRLYGGTGLGLGISRRLIELMGGSIRYDSKIGEGSTFYVELPLHREHGNQHDGVLENSVTCLSADYEAQQRLQRMGVRYELHKENGDQHGKGFLMISPAFYHMLDPTLESHLNDLYEHHVILLGHLVGAKPGYEWRQIGLLTPARLNRHFQQTLVNNVSERCSSEALEPYHECDSLLDKRILLAEDNIVNAEIAVALLEKLGVQVVCAFNGQEALDAAQSGSFDLVLMDIQMPVMDGYEATKAIRQVLDDKCPPILALTAGALDSDREYALNAGMNDFLTKPLDPLLLLNKLEEWLVEAPAEELIPSQGTSALAKKIFSPEIGLYRIGGNHERFIVMLKRFLQLLEPFTSQSSRGNLPMTSYELHSIKGASANIGGELFAGEIAELERVIAGQAADSNYNFTVHTNRIVDSADDLAARIAAYLKEHSATTSVDDEFTSGATDLLADELSETLTQLIDELEVGVADVEQHIDALIAKSHGNTAYQLKSIREKILSYDYDIAINMLEELKCRVTDVR